MVTHSPQLWTSANPKTQQLSKVKNDFFIFKATSKICSVFLILGTNLNYPPSLEVEMNSTWTSLKVQAPSPSLVPWKTIFLILAKMGLQTKKMMIEILPIVFLSIITRITITKRSLHSGILQPLSSIQILSGLMMTTIFTSILSAKNTEIKPPLWLNIAAKEHPLRTSTLSLVCLLTFLSNFQSLLLLVFRLGPKDRWPR